MRKFLLILLSIFFFVIFTWGNLYLITANRIQQKTENMTEVIKVISEKEIENNGYLQLNDLLDNFTDIYVPRYGSWGTASPKLNGGQSGEILYMIDGIPLMDPSGIERSFNLSNLNLGNIEKIEIITGSEGSLYGTNSNMGVVNIHTKTLEDKNAELYFSIGSYNYYNTGINVNKKIENMTIFLSGQYVNTQGYNLALEGKEKDGVYGHNFFGKIKYNKKKYVGILGFNQLYENLDYDGWNGQAVDADNEQETKKTIYYWKNDFRFTDAFKTNLNFNYTLSRRENYEEGDLNQYEGYYYSGKLKNVYSVNEKIRINFGIDYYNEFAEQKTSFFNNMEKKELDSEEIFVGVFFKKLKNISFNTAFRYISPSKNQWDEKLIYKAGVKKMIPIGDNLFSISANFGTGFNYPTLYQMYGMAYDYSSSEFYMAGNPQLKPEENKTFVIKTENSILNDKISLNGSYKFSDYSDYIKAEYDENYRTSYRNSTRTKTKSYSGKIKVDFFKRDDFESIIEASYSHNTANNIVEGKNERIAMIPSYEYKFRLKNYYKNYSLILESNTVGDKLASYPKLMIEPYTVVNSSLSYNLNNLFINLKIENLLNLDYKQKETLINPPWGDSYYQVSDTSGYVHYPGYNMPGINFKLNFKYRFEL